MQFQSTSEKLEQSDNYEHGEEDKGWLYSSQSISRGIDKGYGCVRDSPPYASKFLFLVFSVYLPPKHILSFSSADIFLHLPTFVLAWCSSWRSTCSSRHRKTRKERWIVSYFRFYISIPTTQFPANRLLCLHLPRTQHATAPARFIILIQSQGFLLQFTNKYSNHQFPHV